MDNKSKKRKSKYLTEPHFSAMMQAIKKVRFEGWKVTQACTEYRVPNRSLRRYVEVSMDESSPFYVRPRLHSSTSNIGHFPPIRGTSATASAIFSTSQDAPTPKRLKPIKATTGCEPAKSPKNNGHFVDHWHLPEDDFFPSSQDSSVFDDMDQLISHNQESLTSPSSPVFESSNNPRTTAAKLPAMTETTNQTPTGNEMEVETDPESRLQIKDCHIQCFLQDIADIDFGF